MLPGFNHNIRHQGILYHVQTEDSGITNPMVVTHIFLGGNIIASRRRSYEKFVKATDITEIVETMMKEQHKEMMKDLVAGKFKGALETAETKPSVSPPSTPPEAAPPPLGRRPPVPPPHTAPRPYRIPSAPGPTIRPATVTPRTLDTSAQKDKTLDELILEFLEDEEKIKS